MGVDWRVWGAGGGRWSNARRARRGWHGGAAIAAWFALALGLLGGPARSLAALADAATTATRPLFEPAAMATPAATPRARADREIVVAAVADAELTLRALQRLVQPRVRSSAERLNIDPDKDDYRYRNLQRLLEEQAVSEWLAVTALSHMARQRGLTVTEEDTRRALEAAGDADRDAQRDSLTDLARVAGMTPEDFDRTVREALLADKYVRLWIGENVADDELRKMYDADPGQYVLSPRRRHLQYFSVVTAKQVNASALRETMDKAQRKIARGADAAEVAAEIDAAQTALFEEAARKRAALGLTEPDDPLAGAGDAPTVSMTNVSKSFDLWITPGHRFPNDRLAKLAFELKPGQVSDVVNSDIGFHFFKVLEDVPEKGKTFEECRPVVIEALMDKIRWELALGVLKSLKRVVVVRRSVLTSVSEDEDEDPAASNSERLFEELMRRRGERSTRELQQERESQRAPSAPIRR